MDTSRFPSFSQVIQNLGLPGRIRGSCGLALRLPGGWLLPVQLLQPLAAVEKLRNSHTYVLWPLGIWHIQ